MEVCSVNGVYFDPIVSLRTINCSSQDFSCKKAVYSTLAKSCDFINVFFFFTPTRVSSFNFFFFGIVDKLKEVLYMQ